MNHSIPTSEAADRLLLAIGEVEEHWLADAIRPRPTIKRFTRSALILAATLSLLISLVVGALIIGQTAHKGSMAGDAIGKENDAEAGSTFHTLSDRLSEVGTNAPTVSLQELDLLDGTSRLIWKYEGETRYRVCNVTEKDVRELEHLLDLGSHAKSDTVPSHASIGIWIARADGTVISPHLQRSEGNVGYGTLFDYDPELEPSKAFTDAFLKLIQTP